MQELSTPERMEYIIHGNSVLLITVSRDGDVLIQHSAPVCSAKEKSLSIKAITVYEYATKMKLSNSSTLAICDEPRVFLRKYRHLFL